MQPVQLGTCRKHRITKVQPVFQFRKMSEKMLYRDESMFTWVIYTNPLLPWEEENTGVAKFVPQVHKSKSRNP